MNKSDRLGIIRNSKLFRIGDLIILGVMILAAVGVALTFLLPEKGRQVEISSGGSVIRRLPLDQNAVVEVEWNGQKNTVVIERSRVYVSEATCGDKLCEKKGWISRGGESIVCLPNQLVVRITGGDVDGAL